MSTRSTSFGDELSLQIILARGPSMLSTLPSDHVLPAQCATTKSPIAGGLTSAAFSERLAGAFSVSPVFLPKLHAVKGRINKLTIKILFTAQTSLRNEIAFAKGPKHSE